MPPRWAWPSTTLAVVWFSIAILACLALLAIADYQRDPEDWKRHRILYVGMIAAAVIGMIVAGVISWRT